MINRWGENWQVPGKNAKNSSVTENKGGPVRTRTTWHFDIWSMTLGGKNTTCMHAHQFTLFQHTAVSPCSLVLSSWRLPSSGLFSGTWALRQAPGDLRHVYVFPQGHCLNSTTRWIANRCMIKKQSANCLCYITVSGCAQWQGPLLSPPLKSPWQTPEPYTYWEEAKQNLLTCRCHI